MILPAGILVKAVSRLWDRFRERRWRRVLQAAILPITAGLVLAAGFLLVRAAGTTLLFAAITIVATGLTFTTKLHPLWLCRRSRARSGIRLTPPPFDLHSGKRQRQTTAANEGIIHGITHP